MKVAIVGSRRYRDLQRVVEFVNALPEGTTVISGGGGDVDLCAEETAKARGLATEIYHADWKKHGRAAGPIRNRPMIAAADRVAAFWDGLSRGTQNAISLASQMGKPCEVFGDVRGKDAP